MEEAGVSTGAVGIRYGLIMSIVSIVYFVTLSAAGVDMTAGFGKWFKSVFYIVLIYLAHRYFKEKGDGFMSYGQGMGIFFWMSLIVPHYSTFFYIYLKFIDSSFIQALKDQQISEMESKGMSQGQIGQGMEIAGAFMTPGALFGFGLFFGFLFILFIGLIVTIITQKRNPEQLV